MGTGQIGLHTCCPTYTDLCETTLCKDVSNPNKVTIGDSRRGGRLSLKLNWMSARHDCPIKSNDLKLARVVNAIAYYRYYQSSIHAAVPEVRKGAFGTVILIVYHDIVARLYIILRDAGLLYCAFLPSFTKRRSLLFFAASGPDSVSSR